MTYNNYTFQDKRYMRTIHISTIIKIKDVFLPVLWYVIRVWVDFLILYYLYYLNFHCLVKEEKKSRTQWFEKKSPIQKR